MKQTITKSDFRDAFQRCGRGEQFSYEALGLIFDYLEEIDEDQELDVVAVCCEFAESDRETIAEDFNVDLSECEDDDEKEQALLSYLEDETSVIGQTSSGIVYIQF